MEELQTRLDGVRLFAPRVFADERGFFLETYRRTWLSEFGVDEEFIQLNHSRSSRGTVRGMHFQIGAGASKLVRCARGAIWDVVVDLRRGSPTFGEFEGFELDDVTHHLLYVPIGFAHGFCVTSDVADVCYQQSRYYSGDVERGFAPDDPQVAIAWPVPAAERVVSERDLTGPALAEIAGDLPFTYDG